jgi:hypothetical protein
VLGVLVGVVLLISGAESAPVVAQALHLPTISGLFIVLAGGVLVLFPSFWFLLVTAGGEHTLFPIPNVERYAFFTSTAVTLGLLLVPILEITGLGILAFVPFVALVFLSRTFLARSQPPGAQ